MTACELVRHEIRAPALALGLGQGGTTHRWLPVGKRSRNRKSEAAIANIDPSDVCDSSVHVGDLNLVTRLDVIYIPEVKNSLEGGSLGLSVELLTDRLFFLLPAVLFFRWGRSVFAIGRKV